MAFTNAGISVICLVVLFFCCCCCPEHSSNFFGIFILCARFLFISQSFIHRSVAFHCAMRLALFPRFIAHHCVCARARQSALRCDSENIYVRCEAVYGAFEICCSSNADTNLDDRCWQKRCPSYTSFSMIHCLVVTDTDEANNSAQVQRHTSTSQSHKKSAWNERKANRKKSKEETTTHEYRINN